MWDEITYPWYQVIAWTIIDLSPLKSYDNFAGDTLDFCPWYDFVNY